MPFFAASIDQVEEIAFFQAILVPEAAELLILFVVEGVLYS